MSLFPLIRVNIHDRMTLEIGDLVTTDEDLVQSNKIQLQILVDFMSTHNHLATGEFTGPLGAKRANSQWQNLKSLLKEHGPDRTVEQWKQTWKDIKKCARTDNAAAARGHSSTGNTKIVPIVSDISTKVLNIIGHECSTGVGPEESIIGQADSIDGRLKEQNDLLRDRNQLLHFLEDFNKMY
ncbi:uncharacterized protein LOC120624300 [Pararge aegeria]|uniref:uncharacterized protein LOC120624300 n=1 Tax=Pararge aegeria TaxID=116150 RepID=UPI0019D0BCA8|nr:uncharacterized protein LOC120624300 [Pararge aegeria]